jgi:molecular chaperone DnaK
MVQERIRSLFAVPPDTSVRPDEAVALGAAVYASRLQLEDGAGLVVDPHARAYLETMKVTDVSAHSLGVSVFSSPPVGGVASPGSGRRTEVLLARNTPLPSRGSKTFYTRHPGETQIVIPVLEGDGPDPDACTRIGSVVIDHLPAARPAYQPVRVTMTYDRDGILEVTAEDETTHTVASTTIERSGAAASSTTDRAAAAVRAAVVL